jgi:hypothetical protein
MSYEDPTSRRLGFLDIPGGLVHSLTMKGLIDYWKSSAQVMPLDFWERIKGPKGRRILFAKQDPNL